MGRVADRIEFSLVEALVRVGLRRDRRRAPRVPCAASASVFLPWGKGTYVAGRLVDVSRLGFQFHGQVPPDDNSERLKLRIDAAPDRILEARIVRRGENRLHCEYVEPLSKLEYRVLLEKIPAGRPL